MIHTAGTQIKFTIAREDAGVIVPPDALPVAGDFVVYCDRNLLALTTHYTVAISGSDVVEVQITLVTASVPNQTYTVLVPIVYDAVTVTWSDQIQIVTAVESKTQADARQEILIAEHDATQASLALVKAKTDLIDAGGIEVVSPLADDGTLTLYNRRTYDAGAMGVIAFTVTKDYQAADAINLIVYTKGDPATELATYPATASSSTNINVDDFTVSLNTLAYDDCNSGFECRYSLVATWGSDYEEIAGGEAYVYDRPSV